jgi:hypothetical protein
LRTDCQHGPEGRNVVGAHALLGMLGSLGLPCAPAETRAALARVPEGTSLDLLARLSLNHGLGGAFYLNLRRAAAEGRLSGESREALRAAYFRTCLVTSARLERLVPVERALASAGIAHVRLKGAALVGDIYDDPGLRPMCDVDLLVGNADVRRAAEALGALGYRPADPSELEPGSRAARRTYHVQLVRDAPGGDLLELHWDMTQREGLLQHIGLDVVGILAGRRGVRPAPEDELLLLAVHLGRHYLRGLMWLADIALYIARYGDSMRWERLVSRAREAGAASLLYAVLAASGHVFGPRGEAPAAARDALRPGLLRRLVLDALVSPRHLLGTAPGPRAFKLVISDTLESAAATAWWASRVSAGGTRP